MISFSRCENLESYFVAKLSDGTEVYQDDLHLTSGQINCWFRLKDHLGKSGLKIVGLRLERNGIQFSVPDNQRGYFFGNRQKAVYPDGIQMNYMGIGYYDGNQVHITWRTNPGFKYFENEIKTKDGEGGAGFLLIDNENI